MSKVIYTFFLGILLAIFIGVGISTFYKEPVRPKAPELSLVGKEGPTQAQQAQQTAFDRQMEKFDKEKMNPYNRNVSVAALVAAVVFVALGLVFERRIDVLADGLLLGGIFTLLYSLGRGFASQDSKYGFLAVSISLVAAVGLGYLRFIRPSQPTSSKA